MVWHLDVKGGTQRQALELARHLRLKGHNVTLYCAHLDRDACYSGLLEGFEVVSLGGSSMKDQADKPRWIAYPLEPLFAGEERKLARLIGKHDVVNCHEHRAYRVALIHKKTGGAPAVWMMNDLPTSFGKPRRPKNAKAIISYSHYLLMGGLMGRWIDVRRAKLIDVIVVLDRRNRDHLKNEVGLDSTVVRSGLDLGKFSFVGRREGGSDPPFMLFTIGIFFSHRRFEDIVNALGLLNREGRDVHLRLAGLESKDPRYSSKVRALATSLGLENHVEFLGAISEEQLVVEYSSADAFVFPNSPQTWGLAVFEAMACGAPVVVSKGCGASEVLTDGEDALLVEPGAADGYAAAVRRLMDDHSLRERLSASGRRFVEENIRWDLYADHMMAEFEKVTGAKDESR